MSGALSHHSSPLRPPKPLIVRAGLSRTFGSLAGFAALGLLTLGIYLLADAFAHPVDAQVPALLVAAFAIALAIPLFFFLFKPRRIPEMFRYRALESSVNRDGGVVARGLFAPPHPDDLRKDLAYQRSYVDRARVRQ